MLVKYASVYFAALGNAAALAFLCVVPFALPLHVPPLLTLHAEALAIFFAVVVILTAPRARANVAAAALVLFAGYLMVQSEFMTPFFPTLAAVYVTLAALLMMTAPRPGRITILIMQWALTIGGTLVALSGFAFLGGDAFGIHTLIPDDGRMVGVLGQPNIFANYCALGLASLILVIGRRIGLVIAVPLALLLTSAIVLSHSRIGAAFILIIFLVSPNIYRSAKWLLCAFAALHVTVALIEKLGTSEFNRLALWSEAARIWSENPILGVGFGQFPRFIAPELPHDPHAHNIFLQLLAETGLVGVAIIVGGFSWAWARRPRVTFTNDRAWALTLLLIEGAHSLTEFPLWYAHFLFLTAIAFGTLTNEPDAEIRHSADAI